MKSFTIFTSSAMVDHVILYYFPQQRFGKWLDVTCIASEVQKQHLKSRNSSKILLKHKNVFRQGSEFQGFFKTW